MHEAVDQTTVVRLKTGRVKRQLIHNLMTI